MCRITGFIDFNHKADYELESTLVRMRDTMTHGGPDDAGVFIDKRTELPWGTAGFLLLTFQQADISPCSLKTSLSRTMGDIQFRRDQKRTGGIRHRRDLAGRGKLQVHFHFRH